MSSSFCSYDRHPRPASMAARSPFRGSQLPSLTLCDKVRAQSEISSLSIQGIISTNSRQYARQLEIIKQPQMSHPS